MPVLTAASWKASVGSGIAPGSLLVVSLCAAWCDTCNEFRTTFERIAQARPQITFLWLDIEDDAEICGDIDVENFPTLAVWRHGALVFFGVSLPQEGSVTRLVDALARDATAPPDAPVPVIELGRRLTR